MSWRQDAVRVLCTLVLLGCSPLPTDVARDAPAMTPTLADSSRMYSQVVAGFVHSCALTDDGAAVCWGNNDYGQLGTDAAAESCGGRPCSSTPVSVSGGRSFTVLAAGWVHNCGIASGGAAYCWGGGAQSGRGYLGDGAVSRSETPVRVLADSAFVAVTIGDGHTCALTESGLAYCWGQNDRGQVGDGTDLDRSSPVLVSTSLRFLSLSAGAYHTCGVTTSNAAYCWGDHRWGQLGVGDVEYNSAAVNEAAPPAGGGGLLVAEIAAGWQHTCALTTTGAAYCWGRNDDARQLGDGSDATLRGTPARVVGGMTFVALTAGPLSTCGHTAADALYCWGGNYYGGLGNGETDASGVGHPVRAQGGPFADVGIGQGHACAIKADQRLWCWGDQSAGQF
ncbi:MAG: hypothetical protein WD801_08585 [Gemmatimonadaceae bacterium]